MSAPIRIDHLMAGFADGDAISHEARVLRDVFRRWGLASDVFADPAHVSPPLRAECRPLSEYRAKPTDLVIHQYGIASPAAEVFAASPARKILLYQNITPASFFRGFDDALARRLAEAREDLGRLARRADAVWAASRYSASELEAMGVPEVKVLPLHFDPATVEAEPEPQTLAKFSGPLTNILFVGRMAPNKRVEDLILAFAWYQKSIHRYSRLVLVGSNRSCPRYYAMLRMLAGELDLPNVCFEGFLNARELAACYRTAHVYVCPSEHEGYCLPLIEAMHRGVPVLARRAGGMPEALDGAGVLYDGLGPRELAELIHLVVTDAALRRDVLDSQQRRLEAIRKRPVDRELRELLAELLP
jgi:glycosyltransferase involved in cell wall biosynthesis